MAAALVQVGTGGGLYASSGTAIPVAMPSAPGPGNTLVAFAGGYRVANYTGGSYRFAPVYTNDFSASLGFKLAGPSESTSQSAAQSGSGNFYFSAVALEISGLPATNGIIATNSGNSLSSNTYTAAAISTTVPGAFVSAFVVDDYSGVTGASISTGWTLLGPYTQKGASNTNAPVTIYVAYQLAAPAGTYSAVLTTNGSPGNHNVETQSIFLSLNAAATRRRVAAAYMLAH